MPLRSDRPSAFARWLGPLLTAFTFLSPCARGSAAEAPSPTQTAPVPASPSAADSHLPRPLPDHPGNVFLDSEKVAVPLPTHAPSGIVPWHLRDDQGRVLQSGELPAVHTPGRDPLPLGTLGIGWYMLEFGPTNETPRPWTTLAVLKSPAIAPSSNSPVAVDSAAAWFASENPDQQRRLASLAALAGVGWVRDRLRWRDLQPAPGPLIPDRTTYETSASVQAESGLQILQVFHDTPPWARETNQPGGRFAGDLRRVHAFAKDLAQRFRGRVAAWEPWNEANAASFGGHTVDEMRSWQKAAWLGFKSGNPDLLVGWNPTAAVPTQAHTEGVLANETWPYFDTYNLHTYDWAHGYADLWKPAREAASGRPIWVTEADRGTPHLKNPPWFDQDPALERLKAEWMAQAYAASLFAGASRHFHFILGHYHEPNGVQFGLLRLDLTPRPAYVALAAVGRCLNDARPLGRWRPTPDTHVYAFRARPDGIERDVLVAWAEREVDWPERGRTTAPWPLPAGISFVSMVDHLGRSIGPEPPARLTGAPVFVLLAPGQTASLPLEAPPSPAVFRSGNASPLVLQRIGPRSRVVRVEDLPWSEGHACAAAPGETVDLDLFLYHFGNTPGAGTLSVVGKPADWEVTLEQDSFRISPGERLPLRGRLKIPETPRTRDGWVTVRGNAGALGQPVLAFRYVIRP